VGQVVPGDIYAEGAFTDTIDFNTVPFLFAGNVGYTAGTPLGTATKFVHTPVPFGKGTQISYSVLEGQAGAAYPYTGCVLPDLNLRFMRTGASQVGGRILGKKLPPTTAFPDPEDITVRAGRSINSIKTGVWEAPDWAALATTSTRLDPVAVDLAWRHNNVFAPWFALDDSIVSYGGTLEQEIDAGVQISVVADVRAGDIAGKFTYSSMEDGDNIFLKVLTLGPVIVGSTPSQPYKLELDMCLTISGPPRRATSGPLRIWQWDALMKPNTATPYLPFEITVVCELPADALEP
jgi:hypothetical protein